MPRLFYLKAHSSPTQIIRIPFFETHYVIYSSLFTVSSEKPINTGVASGEE